MDIEYGLLRVRKDERGDDIDVFFEKVFGLPAPRSPRAAGAVPTNVVAMPAPSEAKLPDKTPVDSMVHVETMLREALADPTLPPGEPKLMLANRYLESVVRHRTADIALLSALIADRRETDFRDALRRAVEALGPASAPLARPLLDRIDTELPGQPKLLRELTSSFDASPPGAAVAVMPHLESLAQDEQRRERIYQILPRLAEKGPDSLRYFLAFIDAGPDNGASNPSGPRGARQPGDALVQAGIAGLCRLGPAAASAAPMLFSKLQPLKDVGHMTTVELAEIEALSHMGQDQELATFFTRPPS
jgi:hypothetical protein